MPSIKPGNMLLFYESGGTKSVIGEGRIQDIQFGTVEDALKRFGAKLFLDSKELSSYRTARSRPPSSMLMTIELTGTTAYPVPFRLTRPLTMAGLTFSRRRYLTIVDSLDHGSPRAWAIAVERTSNQDDQRNPKST
jgi:hypothetical protein